MNMKTRILPIFAYLAVLAAFALLPVSAVAASVALSVTGMASILAADYGGGAGPLRAPAPVVPFQPSRLAPAECRAAA
jgi:hypothetical protein